MKIVDKVHAFVKDTNSLILAKRNIDFIFAVTKDTLKTNKYIVSYNRDNNGYSSISILQGDLHLLVIAYKNNTLSGNSHIEIGVCVESILYVNNFIIDDEYIDEFIKHINGIMKSYKVIQSNAVLDFFE